LFRRGFEALFSVSASLLVLGDHHYDEILVTVVIRLAYTSTWFLGWGRKD